MHSRTHGAWAVLLLAAVACLPLLVTACGSDDPPPPTQPPVDTTPPVVTAMPVGDIYPAPQNVTLTANESATIYYTTDLTTPDATSPMYGGPIPIPDDTVLKFMGIDDAGNESDVSMESYVIAPPDSIKEDWANSGHGMIGAEAWRHWDDDGVVQTGCGKCHSPEGFKDYSRDGTVDNDSPLPLGLTCDGCHDGGGTLYDDLGTYPALEPVEFPSGEVASLLGTSNMCMVCHQGRNSGSDVDDLTEAGPGPYSFINIHYYPAAATMFGGEVIGGYQYDGMDYQPRNVFPSHPETFKTCQGCHMRGTENNHTMQPDVDACNDCHGGNGITDFPDLLGSPKTNYDAIQLALTELYTAIQGYATGVIGEPIIYESHTYPYFFYDTNGNGAVDPGEANYGNKYDSFDAELLRGAYNYQMGQKDPCAYVHNGVYARQLFFDSTTALGGVPTDAPPDRPGFDAATASPTEQWKVSGHADAYADAFRHWDEDDPPVVEGADAGADCTKCHTTTGFVEYAATESPSDSIPVGQTVECYACHVSFDLGANSQTRYQEQVDGGGGPLTNVLFPSGARQDLGDNSNMCMMCHQGRESGVSVVNATPNAVDQNPNYVSYDFINRHYYAAAAIVFGADVTAGFEYDDGRDAVNGDPAYQGENTFPAHGGIGRQTCVECHMRGGSEHTWEIPLGDCSTCHSGISDFDELGSPFGAPNVDYDGDGTGEGYKLEIDGMAANLLTEIQTYATGIGYPIVYSGQAYPYFFNDLNGNGSVDPLEDIFPNRYRNFDRSLLEAAYNYHSAQDPCGGIHNYKYVLQTLYDAMDWLDNAALDGSATGTRP